MLANNSEVDMGTKRHNAPRNITAASHEVGSSIHFLRDNVKRGNLRERRLPSGGLLFYDADIRAARDLYKRYLAQRAHRTN
jgi:hypothetical protein